MQAQHRSFSKEEIERFTPTMKDKQTGTGVSIVGNVAWLHIKRRELIPGMPFLEDNLPYMPFPMDNPQLDLSDDHDLIEVMDNINNKKVEYMDVYKSKYDVSDKLISEIKRKFKFNACVVYEVPFILRLGLEKKQVIIKCSK